MISDFGKSHLWVHFDFLLIHDFNKLKMILITRIIIEITQIVSGTPIRVIFQNSVTYSPF